ncbi:hypothetical protein LT493_30160 [Streptomyces tricolor]|nr:hypothetical protein [Streptomyces tricolor]
MRLPAPPRGAGAGRLRQRRGVHVGPGHHPAEGELMPAPSFSRAKWSIAAVLLPRFPVRHLGRPAARAEDPAGPGRRRVGLLLMACGPVRRPPSRWSPP